jgi:circadian clock protein KaiC
MSARSPISLPLLPTGVPGFDAVLGGGLAEYSFNLITGSPVVGMATHQIMFRNASPTRPALYFTVMGEPPIKIMRHQQQFAFFDPAQVGTSVRFSDLSDLVLTEGLRAVLDRIVQQVEETSPGTVIVESFQPIVRVASAAATGALDLSSFVQRLALQLTSWQATTFLIGEFLQDALPHNPLLTVADGIFMLTQNTHRTSVVRNLQVYPRMSISLDETDRVRPHGRAPYQGGRVRCARGGRHPHW